MQSVWAANYKMQLPSYQGQVVIQTEDSHISKYLWNN